MASRDQSPSTTVATPKSAAPAFTLDTSGAVASTVRFGLPYAWSDLDAFAQGYVEALFASACPRCRGAGEFIQTWHAGNLHERLRDHGSGFGWFRCDLGFSSLSPEALAMILADCAAYQASRPSGQVGAVFWLYRDEGELSDFPPLTVSLGDDGKVRLGPLNASQAPREDQ